MGTKLTVVTGKEYRLYGLHPSDVAKHVQKAISDNGLIWFDDKLFLNPHHIVAIEYLQEND